MSAFFLIFTAIPVAAGGVLMAMTPIMKRWMHGCIEGLQALQRKS